MTRGVWGDDERYLETYWRFPGVWTHGDWASVDEDGYWFLHGRSDDTLNIAGKRIGPAELESAALGLSRRGGGDWRPHEVKGEAAWIFVALKPGAEEDADGIKAAVAGALGKAFAPERVLFVSALPKALRQRSSGAPSAQGARRGSRRSRPWRTPRPWRRSRMPSRALVTGGGRGIGAGIARELAANGWHVTVTGRTSAQVEAVAGRSVGAPWSATSRSARGRRADARRGGAHRPARRERRRRTLGGVWETNVDEWWRVLEVNVLEVYLIVRLALPGMIERGGGRIVITGSGASYLPDSTSGAYGASKAAVGRLARSSPSRSRTTT